MKRVFKYKMRVALRFMSLLFIACGDTAPEVTFEPSEVDVYLAGVEKGELQTTVKVWKNGTAQTIMRADGTLTEVVDMVVHNGKVYVAISDAVGNGAYYWADGERVELTSPWETNAWATGITVHENDVYVSGYIQGKNNSTRNVAVYWKNGTAHLLSEEHPLSQYYARAIATVNGEVLVAGESDTRPVVWSENGAITPLEFDDYTMNNARYYIRTISHSDADLYVYADIVAVFTGYRRMVYWKNGTAHYPVGRELHNSVTRDFFVKGNDVYIAGASGFYDHAEGGSVINPAAYWKNGEMVLLGSKTQHGTAHAIGVTSNDDIYAAGREGSRATLWINGQKQSITAGNNSVFQAMVLVE